MPRMGNAGEAVGRATEQLGETIMGVAHEGFKYAGKLRQMNDATAMSAFLTEKDSQAAEFEAGLIKRQDYSNWNQEWSSNVNSWKGEIDNLNISNEAKARLQIQYGQWAAGKGDRLSTTAALKDVEVTKGTIANNLTYYGKRGDTDGYNRTVNDARDTGIFRPDQIQSLEIQGEQLKFQSELDGLILNENPDKAREYIQSDAFMKNPGATLEMREMALNQVDEVSREKTNVAIDQFADDVANKAFTSEDQIEQKYGGRVRPAVLKKMKEGYAYEQTQAFKQLQATPDYQNRVRGRVSSLLADFNAKDPATFDESAVEINRLINSLPPGDPTREQLQQNFNEKRSGQLETVKSLAALTRNQFVEAYKGQFFGKTIKEQSTDAAIDSGLLRDTNKLMAGGLSEDQANEIAGKPGDKDSDRRARFLQIYPKRETKEPKLHPFLQKQFQAIQAGETKATWEDPAEVAKAEKALGDISFKFDLWARQNPDKLNDQEALGKIAGQLVSPFGVKKFTETIIVPPPPSVLPELDENDQFPMVDPFLPR